MGTWSTRAYDHRRFSRIAPAHYLQGPGAIEALGEFAASLGSSCLVICDAMVRQLYWPAVARCLAAAGVNARVGVVVGEVVTRYIVTRTYRVAM